MPLHALCHEQAAEELLSADAMLVACPHLESAKCARVEVSPSPLHRVVAQGSLVSPLFLQWTAVGCT